MARTPGFPLSLWRDGDFTKLGRQEQWMYFLLMYGTCHTNNLGVVPVTLTRWSNMAADVTPLECLELVRRLGLTDWVVLDESLDELFLPRYMEDSRIAKQPNMLRGAIAEVDHVWSPSIRLAIADVFSRIDRKDAQAAASDIRAGTKLAVGSRRVTRPSVPAALRTSVYDRDSWKCSYCSLTFEPAPIGRAPEDENLGIWLELDHIKPYSLGGEDTYDNFRSACSTCNRRRGVDDADLWAERIGVH